MEDAVEKLLYLMAQDINERWGKKKLEGFGLVKEQLDNMYKERYQSYSRVVGKDKDESTAGVTPVALRAPSATPAIIETLMTQYT